jgi:hypothetical protein
VRQAYNPYTGGYAQSARVNTAHGSAGRFYAEQGGKSAWGGYRSTSQGTVAGARTSEGAGFAAWDTRYSQGAVAKGKDGNVYAGKDGTVYKKDNSGVWTSNSGSGWESVDKPQPRAPGATTTSTSSRAQPSATRNQPSVTPQTRQPSSTSWGGTSRDSVQSLDSQANSRSWGNRQASSASSLSSSASTKSRSGRR